MIDCKHIEYIYDSPFHGDVFDHPSYKTYCHCKGKDIHRWLCTRCEQYEPNYLTLSDCELLREFTSIKEKLDSDDHATIVNKLLKMRELVLQEAERRASSV